MRLMPRDEQVLKWINGFGCVTADQIARFLGVPKPAFYHRLKKMTEAGFLTHEYVLHGCAGVYKLTKLGTQICGDGLSPLKEINLGIFRHDLALVDLSLDITQELKGEILPHRRIRRDLGLRGVGQAGHIADAYFYAATLDKPVAIELELTMKGRTRLNEIINNYGGDLSVREVWYFSPERGVRSAVEKASQGYSFIKIFTLPEGASQNLKATERVRA